MKNEEIEIKYYIADLQAMERRISDAGAKLTQARIFETNLRFDTVERSLSRNNQVLRLRYDSEARLTYKGPTMFSGGTKIRQEIEFVVESFEKAKLLLEALNYQVMMVYEKYRTTYQLDLANIVLDELPYGNFIEIEGPSVETVTAISKRLRLDPVLNVQGSYVVLFDELCRTKGWTFRDLSFENFVALNVTAMDLNVVAADLIH